MDTNKIFISQIEGHNKQYLAYFKSEFLDSTFSVYFCDSILGSVALTQFYQMIKSKYNNVELVITKKDIAIKNPALLDKILSWKGV
ncbi:MAG: hypothetical protein MJB14_09175 [Spirochaetes bacterium]|nr:hypothetical protein [Spirochaetota bacterium]